MTRPQLSKNIIFPIREDSEPTKDNDDRPKYSVPPGQPLQTIDSNPQLPSYSNLKYQSTLPSSATYDHWKGSQSLPENLHLYAESDKFPGQLDSPSRNVHLPEYEFGFVPLYSEKFTRNRNAPKSETPLASQDSTKIQSYLLSEKGPLSSQSQFNYLTTSKRLVLDCGSSNQIDWCDLGEQYPRSEVNYVIQQCLDTISRMYVEIPTNLEDLGDSEPLDYFYNYSENGRDQWKWTRHSFHKEALCESNQRFVYPSFARDSTGSWNVIVQAEEFPQRVPVEFCRVQGGPCTKIATCGLVSRCVQKYNYQLLMSIDPAKPDVCPTMKLYKFPSACLCHAQIEKPVG
ncbi:uncharacterized protein LOC143236439 [Tachypleus tridentatus]|uniref:uncharacterized protein LOC143236439 n=1 Tax=Tachypleus tridentatus TaxID=6853 RepID=UPI003FD52C5D